MSGKNAADCYESLDEQVALITGATRGIGAAIASELTDLGATVYAGARDTDDITDPDQRAIRLDVTDESEIETAIDRIADEVGQLDILVNNAGVFNRSGPLHEMSIDEFDHTLEVNLRGPTLVTKHALSLLLEQDGARVVHSRRISGSSHRVRWVVATLRTEYRRSASADSPHTSTRGTLQRGSSRARSAPDGFGRIWAARTRIEVPQRVQILPYGCRDSNPEV